MYTLPFGLLSLSHVVVVDRQHYVPGVCPPNKFILLQFSTKGGADGKNEFAYTVSLVVIILSYVFISIGPVLFLEKIYIYNSLLERIFL